MLAHRIKTSARFGLSRGFSTSVCLLAGMPSMDANGAAIMNSLKEKSQGKIEFFGLGGEKMVSAGLQDNFGCLNKLPDKPLYMFNNANPHHRERLYAIYMAATRFKNWRVVKEIEAKLHTQLLEKQPSAVISLGNEYFMKRLYLKIDKTYQDPRYGPILKPAMLYYDRLMVGQTVEHLKYLDHYVYTVPYHPPNWQYYKFPSTFAGSQGLFDAYSYLYRQSSKYNGLASEQGIYLNKEYNSIIMEELILESRAAFRKKYSISEESTVFFGSIGSDRLEVKWSLPIVQKAVNGFLEKFSKVSPENFTVVLSLPHGSMVLIQNWLIWESTSTLSSGSAGSSSCLREMIDSVLCQ